MNRTGWQGWAMLRAVGALALLLLVAPAGHAAVPNTTVPDAALPDPAKPGETVTGVLEIAGKQVPLPPGAWVVAATGVQPAGTAEAPYGVVRSAILMLRDGDDVRALVEVNANDISVGAGWAAPCGNDPLPAERRLRYRSRYDAACAEAGETRLDWIGPPAWQAARAVIARDHLHLPDTMLTAMAVCANRQDFLEVRVHLRRVPGVDDDARRKALLDWAGLYASLVGKGLSRDLGGLLLDFPSRAMLLQDDPVLDRRLLRIEALRRTGVITPRAAAEQESAALQEVAMSAVDPNPRTNTLFNQITSPLINLGTAYSVTRNAALSVAIAASEHVTRLLLVSANETRWDAIERAVMPTPSPMPVLQHLGTPVNKDGLPRLQDLAR